MTSMMKTIIENKDYTQLRRVLAQNPELANEGITIPFDDMCEIAAHPLHRICDAIFSHRITDEEGVEFAKILLEFGADVNGDKPYKSEDTPLHAASSLHAEKVGILYIEAGADIHRKDKNTGATALHWAAYCGRDELVKKLIERKAEVNIRDKAYDSTPLIWALQTVQDEGDNKHQQLSCIKLLLKAGAETKSLDENAIELLDQLAEEDQELKNLLS